MINWGIIGCGDVTEVKSGPAFNKVPGSRLVAVMRRDAAKAADYAKRHNVPRWYSDAAALINDAEVNAIYIATPPSSHEAYALAAIHAGKPVYVEKPMTMSYAAAQNMAHAANAANIKLTVAHYRRQWPLFQKIRSLLAEKAIGEVRLVQLKLYKQPPTAAELSDEKYMWRFDPAIAGGGLFHDLAPHQLDILYWLFGEAASVNGLAINQGGYYTVPDLVNGQILFSNKIVFTGSWCFTAAEACDECEIIGSEGSLRFSFFTDNIITLQRNKETTQFDFERLQHVQQPMIEAVANYFSGNADNPCSAEEGATIMRWMDEMGK
ncbi:MAG: Gfo/Idh/MocA family oxidoreductase [Chitinophagaceae bacterium]|nr:Gfo/Idh/MocA family oxidoreductase [Chitinophagaceae bacterium]